MGGCATCRMVIELRPGLHPCKEDQETGPVRNHRTDRRITGHLAARGLRVELRMSFRAAANVRFTVTRCPRREQFLNVR